MSSVYMDIEDELSRRRLLSTSLAAAIVGVTGCMDASTVEDADAASDGDEEGDVDEDVDSMMGTKVNLSFSEGRVRVNVDEAGDAFYVRVERLDSRHSSPGDVVEPGLEGDVVGELDVVAGEHTLTLTGDAEGTYAVVAVDADGGREVVDSFSLPQ